MDCRTRSGLPPQGSESFACDRNSARMGELVEFTCFSCIGLQANDVPLREALGIVCFRKFEGAETASGVNRRLERQTCAAHIAAAKEFVGFHQPSVDGSG